MKYFNLAEFFGRQPSPVSINSLSSASFIAGSSAIEWNKEVFLLFPSNYGSNPNGGNTQALNLIKKYLPWFSYMFRDGGSIFLSARSNLTFTFEQRALL